MFKKFSAIILFMYAFSLFADMTSGKFNFGTDWNYANSKQESDVVQSVDYITIWFIKRSYDAGSYGKMVEFCKNKNKTAVFYSYIIAKASDLGDSDVGGKLATEGAKWLKNNFSTVKSIYENYAAGIAKDYGTDKPCIWLMEPDYYQYFSGNQSEKLSFSDAANYMNELISIIKKHLPKALISLDISPWNNDQATYLKAFDMSKFTFMHTSGGRTEAGNERIRMDSWNNVKWKDVSSISGKPIIADDGYGVGGASTGHDASWDDVNNLKARIKDGVIAITQKDPNSNWNSTINSLKTSLSSETVKGFDGGSSNPTPQKYKLTLSSNPSSGGTVSANPSGTQFEKDTKVSLTAKSENGYKFKNWTGDATGSNLTTEIKMDKDKNITAEFEKIASEEFTLNVQVNGSGSVNKNPDQSKYSNGTKVTLTAKPQDGHKFKNWSGDFSGSNSTIEITMDKNKNITAEFEKASSDEFTLEVKITGSGTVAKNPDQSTYKSGTTVTLTATPAAGKSVFSGWSGAVSGQEKTVTITINSNQTVTATFKDTAVVNGIKVEAEDFTEKTGDELQIKNDNNCKYIGEIKSGHSTTYKVNIPVAGKYKIEFRASNNLHGASFGVTADDKYAGNVTLSNTGGWDKFIMVPMQEEVQLEAGQHTIKLSFYGEMNLDYFILSKFGASSANSSVRNNYSSMKVFLKKNGFRTTLPFSHGYTFYLLVNMSGRNIRTGMITPGTSELVFDDLNHEVIFLRLEGEKGVKIVRAAVVR